jgi:hypothetical protein
MATRMLYRHPGKYAIHGDFFDFVIADQADVAALIKDGWCMTTTQALENSNHEISPKSNVPGKKRIYNDVTEKEMSQLYEDSKYLNLKQLSERYDISTYTVKKIIGEMSQAAQTEETAGAPVAQTSGEPSLVAGDGRSADVPPCSPAGESAPGAPVSNDVSKTASADGAINQ